MAICAFLFSQDMALNISRADRQNDHTTVVAALATTFHPNAKVTPSVFDGRRPTSAGAISCYIVYTNLI